MIQPFLCLLNNRGVIRVIGKDRFDFLQGLITQDIFLLKNQASIYAALLSPQGRYLFDFFVLNQGDDFFIISTRAQDLLKRLSMYKLKREVNLELLEWQVYINFGAKQSVSSHQFTDPRKEIGLLWHLAPTPLTETTSHKDAYHAFRITHGLPESDTDLIFDKTFPLEAGLHGLNAISFSKGCYVGQELTTRTYHRGSIRKKLIPVKIQALENFSPETRTIIQNEQDVGDLRSYVFYGNEILAMAMIRLDALEQEAPLLLGQYGIFPLL